MLLRSCPLLFLILTGCVLTPQQPVPMAAQPVQESPGTETRDEGWKPEDLPGVELSADLLLRFLAGDIAAQRGQTAFAAKSWLDLAQRTRDPRIARRAVELALGSGQLTAALDAAQIWVERSPQSVLARQLYVSLLIRANRLDVLEEQVPAFLALPERELADFYMQLHQLWERKADQAQVARLTGLLTAGKDAMPEAHFALAVMHASRTRLDVALGELDVALKLRPWWEPAVMYKVQLLRQRNDVDAALALLREAGNKNPMQQAYPLAQARLLNELQRTAEARAVYETILARQPDQIEALVGVGLLALQARDFDVAHDMLSAALSRGASNADLLRYYLGQIDEERRQYRQALEWYRQVAGDEQRHAQMRIPRLWAKQGNEAQAQVALSTLSAESDQEKIENIQIEGQVWRELKQPAKGHEVLTRGIAQYPDALDLYYDRSLMADLLQRYAEGEADLRYMLERDPDNVNALNALGYLLTNRANKLEEAQVLLEQAIAVEPDNPVIIDSVGWLRFKQGRLSEALEWLERAYRLLPDPEIAAHYAEVLWVSGKQQEAKRVLDAALAGSPEEEILLEVRKRLGW